MPASPLSKQQLADAASLKSIFRAWQQHQRDKGAYVSQEEASEVIGFGQSALSQYLNGKIPLNIDAATKIAKLVGCQVSDFSQSLAQQAAGYTVQIGGIRGQKNLPDEHVIPQFDTGGAMGSGLLLQDQPGEIRGWTVSQEWLTRNIKNYTGAANLCIVTGFGDSMKGMFNPGDPLLVDRGITIVEYDAVYFFRVGNQGFIKRLQRIPGQGLVVLSENEKYKSWVIDSTMDFEVFGRVVKAWCGEDF